MGEVQRMPQFPRGGDEFGELGFTQQDRDELKKAAWTLEALVKRFDEVAMRVQRLEDGRAHLRDFETLVKTVEGLRMRVVAAGGAIAAILALEPILVHLFWR